MTPRRAFTVLVIASLVLAGPLANQLAAQYPAGLLQQTTSGCTIETRPVAFGNYDVLANFAATAQGQVKYACFSQFPRTIRIELSRGSAGTYNRRMTSGFDHLFYNLYLDATYRNVWGDGSYGTDYYSASYPPFGTTITVPVYARMPGSQDVAVGAYSDTLQAKILF
jgi:spore coat protein U-like protein